MKPSDQAKEHGCKDLKQLQEFTGFTRPTLNKMCYEKPEKFRVFCVACVCDELGLTGQELRDYVKLKQSIEGR